VIYEVFKSPEALDAHRKTEHYQECVRRIDPILVGPRTKTFYNVEMADFLGAGQA
ncbi:antibiotic biosynthesis monooxygenase, partial [Sinorhizobium meliloti]